VTIFRAVRDVVIIVACLCVIAATLALFMLGARIRHAVEQVDPAQPAPAVTGCPFGPDACGG
jgi:hypothetical protein